MRYEYILFNLFIIAGPFLATLFYPSPVLLDPLKLLSAIALPFIFFAIWDHVVTDYFWRFNRRFIVGLFVGKLPVEELLFFIVVPVACLFLYVNLGLIIPEQIIPGGGVVHFVIAAILTAINVAATLKKRWYTATVCSIACGSLFLDVLLGTYVLSTTITWYYLGLVVVLLTIFNGYLTARPILIYDCTYMHGFRIATIPIEDYLYGLSLVLLNLIIYNAL